MLIASALHRAAASAPNKPSLIVGDWTMDYLELDRAARHRASKLIASGVAPGDRVALHMHNSFELAVSYFACFYAGAVAVPVNTRMKAAEIAYVLEHSGASLYLGQPELFEQIRDLPACFPNVRQFATDMSEIDVSARRLAAARNCPPSRRTSPPSFSIRPVRPPGPRVSSIRTALSGMSAGGLALAGRM